MPARNSVSTSWIVAAGAAKTVASSGNDGTSMCSAAGAIAVTRISRVIGGRPLLICRPGQRCRSGSERHSAADHAAVHDAPVSAHVVIGDGAVQQAAVV